MIDPPIIPNIVDDASHDSQNSADALALIEQINTNVQEAQDNLLTTKVSQAESMN